MEIELEGVGVKTGINGDADDAKGRQCRARR
jgi:hypothetical protein